MLYRLLQFPARIALHFYCRSIKISNKEMLHKRGPLILAANHPNSFLDAILMASIFRQPVYSLARGDAFVSKFVNRLLQSLLMMPVYRISEGVGNLENNYSTFSKVEELLSENKTILIFSEGRCINEWHLRPLKKGTARLALTAWKNNIPLDVIPVGINYSSFRRFGKRIDINFGNAITPENIGDLDSPKAMLHFNTLLKKELEKGVYEINIGDIAERKNLFEKKLPRWKYFILFIPAFLGILFNAPLYYAAHWIIKDRANDHYDSILVGILFLFYPLYLLLVTLFIFLWSGSYWSLTFLLAAPATALTLLHFRSVVK